MNPHSEVKGRRSGPAHELDAAEAVVKLVDDRALDQPMPRISGYLATMSYLFPRLGRGLRPMLEKKGRRTKERLKRERKAGEE